MSRRIHKFDGIGPCEWDACLSVQLEPVYQQGLLLMAYHVFPRLLKVRVDALKINNQEIMSNYPLGNRALNKM
ncbi:hypothetical protein YC2023_099993 [Brassica napus]